MKRMMVRTKMSVLPIVAVMLIAAFSADSINAHNQNDAVTRLSAETYLGEWTATTYLEGNKIQTTDFFPEKYIGNTMSIGEGGFNMGHWAGILPPVEVKQYVLLEENLEHYIDENRLPGDLGIDAATLTVFACDTVEGVREEIGIVIDDSHLICATGTGWYLYEKSNE